MSNVAIHQPEYFPWLNFFFKMKNCNKFIFLDSVQYSKRSFQNRNILGKDGNSFYITVPIVRASRDTLISDIKIDNTKRKKHSALLDCKLLLEIYINLVDQKEPKLNFDTESQEKNQTEKNTSSASYYSKKIIKPTTEEIDLHKNFLKNFLNKNYFN